MTAEYTVPGHQPGMPAGYTQVTIRPRIEHAGPHMRLGIRGLTSLVEETLVHWFRVRGISPAVLSERFGMEYAIVDCSSVCTGTVALDDEVVGGGQPVGARHFQVSLTTGDGEGRRVAMRTRVTAVLVRRPGSFETPPDEVSGMVVDGIDQVRAAVP